MKQNKDYAEITKLRIEAGLLFKDLALKVGYSPFWLRERICSGNKEVIEKTKAILYKELS